MNTTTASASSSFTPALGRLVATVSVGFVVTQLDVTIVNVALPTISADLHASVASLQWIVDAYTLAFAALMLLAGVLGDRLGARRLFTIGMAIFALASLACALALDATTLVAARALQGIGAAAMLPNSLALLNQACRHDPKLRARAVGLWTAAGGISIAVGPVAGGILVSAFGWRSIFYVNVPLCIAGLVASYAWIPRQPETVNDSRDQPRSGARPSLASASLSGAQPSLASSPRSEAQPSPANSPRSEAHPSALSSPQSAKRPSGIDPLGQVLAIVALIALTGAVIEWRPLGLGHPLVAGGLVLALVASIALVVVEARVATPMLPLSMFGNRTFSAAVLFGICVNLTYYGTVFVLSLFLQRVRGYAPLAAGLAFLPLTGGFLISNVASGWVIGRHGVRVPMLIGAAIAALGYGLLHFVDANTPLIAMLVPFVLIPSGMGLAVPAMTTSVLASVEHARAGTASAVLNTARQAGGAAGVAAFGALAGGAQAAHIVSGLQVVAAISVVLLIIAAALACLIHPESHAR